MKLFTFFGFSILFCFLLNEQASSQTKRVTLNVKQPPIEQCIVSETNELISKNISIYPNPSEGLINVYFGNVNWGPRVVVQIRSLLGTIVCVFEENPGKGGLIIRYDFTSLPKGLYFLYVLGEDISLNEQIVLL